MKNIRSTLQRSGNGLAALALVAGLAFSAWLPGHAAAAGIINDRSIQISSSIASDTGVEYKVGFTGTSNANSIAIDFCSASPLFEDTCTAPAGLSVSSAVLSAQTGTSGWAIVGAATTASHLEIGGATALTGGTPATLTLTTITNPSTTGAFFARIYTYGAADPDWTGAGSGLTGTVVDFGGVALSTADVISITARVQEKLTFCVSSAAMSGNNCTGQATPVNLTLGSGTPVVLSTSAPDTDVAYVQITTNATNGVTVRMKNNNSCGGLSNDNGTNCYIEAVNSGSATAAAITGGTTGEFGMYCTPDAGLTAQAPYASGTTDYGMDTVSGENVTTTYGSTILTSAGPIDGLNSSLTFGAQATLTTPAGIYTAQMDLIATGTF